MFCIATQDLCTIANLLLSTTKPFMHCGNSPAGGKAFCFVEPFKGGARVKFCTEDGTICEDNNGIMVNISTVTFLPNYRQQWKSFLAEGTENTWKVDVKMAGVKKATEVMLAEYFKTFPEAHEKIRIRNEEYSTGGGKKRKTTTQKGKAVATSANSKRLAAGTANTVGIVGAIGGEQSLSSAFVPVYEEIGLTARGAITKFMQGELLIWEKDKDTGIKLSNVLHSAFQAYGLDLDFDEAQGLGEDKQNGVINVGMKYKRIGYLFLNLKGEAETINRLSEICLGREKPVISESSKSNISTALTNTQSTLGKDAEDAKNTKNRRKAETETDAKDTERPPKRQKRQDFDPTHFNWQDVPMYAMHPKWRSNGRL